MVIPLTPVTPRDSVCLCLGCWEVRECLLEKRDYRGLIAVLALAYVSVHGFRVLAIAAADGPAIARYGGFSSEKLDHNTSVQPQHIVATGVKGITIFPNHQHSLPKAQKSHMQTAQIISLDVLEAEPGRKIPCQSLQSTDQVTRRKTYTHEDGFDITFRDSCI